MFENLNRYSEILILTAVIILPFCHFLDKEGYHFTWNWFASKLWIISILSILVEVIETVCLVIKSLNYSRPNKAPLALDPEAPSPIIKSTFSLNLLYFQFFSKLYNIVLIYLVYNFVSSVIKSDFAYSNFLFDRLFVISICVFLAKVTMLHKNNQSDPSLPRSLNFAFFCFNLATNLFLLLLTVSDTHKQTLISYLTNLKYRDIEDIAAFLEILNLVVIFRLIWFGVKNEFQSIVVIGLFLILKLLFINQNSVLNSVSYFGIPLLNGLIFFKYFNEDNMQISIKKKLLQLFRKSEDRILGI